MTTEPPAGGRRGAKQTRAAQSTAKQSAAKKQTRRDGDEKTATKTTADKRSSAARTGPLSPNPPEQRPLAPGAPPTDRLEAPDEVVRAAAAIIDVFEHRPDLYLAACANPVRALRDAGVQLSPSAERWVAHRCRFSPEETEELDRLVEQVTRYLGDVDPDDDAAVRRSLRDIGVDVPLAAKPAKAAPTAPAVEIAAAPVEQASRQRLRPTGPAKQLHPARRSVLLAAEQLPQVRRWREARRADTDPLEEYKGAHAVMKPLLEYRRRSATQLRFASDELYERLAATKGGQLASGINIELHVRFTGNGDD